MSKDPGGRGGKFSTATWQEAEGENLARQHGGRLDDVINRHESFTAHVQNNYYACAVSQSGKLGTGERWVRDTGTGLHKRPAGWLGLGGMMLYR